MTTINDALAMPMLGMMLLTMLVWIYMFIQRVGYAQGHGIDIEEFKTPGDTASLIPGSHSSASNNFKNLFEMPVVFYAICVYLTVFGGVDDVHVACAWVFLGFRVLHSLVHCSYNRVIHRFVAYAASSIVLLLIWIRLGSWVLAY